MSEHLDDRHKLRIRERIHNVIWNLLCEELRRPELTLRFDQVSPTVFRVLAWVEELPAPPGEAS